MNYRDVQYYFIDGRVRKFVDGVDVKPEPPPQNKQFRLHNTHGRKRTRQVRPSLRQHRANNQTKGHWNGLPT